MRKGEQLRITELEGTIVTVEHDGVIQSFDLEAADDGHRGHGGLGFNRCRCSASFRIG